MTGIVDLFARGFLVAVVELDFQVFTDVDRSHAGVAHVGQSALDGFALRIDDRFFRGDNDFGFQIMFTSAGSTG